MDMRIQAATRSLVLPVVLSFWLLGGRGLGDEPSSVPRLDVHGDPLPAGALARFGSVRYRNDGEMRLLAFTPDDRHLLAGDTADFVRFIDVATGRRERSLRLEGT